MQEENKKNEEKKITIIQGTGRDIQISDVKDNLTFEIHDNKDEKKNIIIPGKKDEENNNN